MQVSPDVIAFIILTGTVIGGFYQMQTKIQDNEKRLDKFEAQWDKFQSEHTILLREVTGLNARITTLIEAMNARLILMEEIIARRNLG